MEEKKVYSKDELKELARSMFVEGCRSMEIFKFLNTKTEDKALINEIIQNIQSDENVMKEREKSISDFNERINPGSKTSPIFYILIGIVVIIFGFLFTRLLLGEGFISGISILFLVGGLGFILFGLRK